VNWKLDIKPDLTLDEYLELRCDKNDAGLKKIMPTIKEMNNVVIYHACKANVYTAMKRDCIEVPTPDKAELKKFLQWYDGIFEKEIVPLLTNFDYDFNSWYNHLTCKQQNNLSQVDPNNIDKLHKRLYKMFCKKEKQEQTDENKYPKNRCICGPNEEYKFVMGPVIYLLELVFKKKFKGYCSGRSWTERENNLNYRRKLGLIKTVQGDGSGFDRTQHDSLKYVEKKIYTWLAEHGKIKHVPESVFVSQACRETITIAATNSSKAGKYSYYDNMGYVNKTGGVQTGNCDTTFANTLRMIMYNRYVMECKLKLHPEEYDLDVAGDDFAIFVKPDLEDKLIHSAYQQVYTKNKTGIHGLGQILKFLRIGTIEDIDFCSTETFWSSSKNTYKIIRKVDRFLTLTPWSQKCLRMSIEEQFHYMMELYEANKLWIGNLPILSDYNEMLKTFAFKILHTKFEVGYKPKSPKYKQKKLLPVEQKYASIYADAYGEAFQNLQNTFGDSEAYAMMVRISDKSGCEKDFQQYLLRKYNVLEGEISLVERQLKYYTQHLQPDYEMSLPLLRKMCDFKKNYDQLLDSGNKEVDYFY